MKFIERPSDNVNLLCFCAGFRIHENPLKSLGLLSLFLKECDACRGSFILWQTVTLLAFQMDIAVLWYSCNSFPHQMSLACSSKQAQKLGHQVLGNLY